MLAIIVSLIVVAKITVVAALAYRIYRNRKLENMAKELFKKKDTDWKPRTREQNIFDAPHYEYDLLIIGGGSTGAGCALDASARGLKVALIDAGDFSSETSSKSTKLLHGGIRYLEKALKYVSITQLLLVFEALGERSDVMRIAPYLTMVVPMMVPVYKRHAIPYYWILLKIYDKLSYGRSLGRSRFISSRQAMMNFSNLKRQNLEGAMVYYDGMFDDARTNIMLVVTASFYGATVLNHTKLKNFVKDDSGNIVAAVCTDRISGNDITIRARGFISAAGPFTDEVSVAGNIENEKMMVHSAGTHVVYPAKYGPEQMGLIDARTKDGRVVFIMPWKGKMIAGTTENMRPLESGISPTKSEVEFLHEELQGYLEPGISKSEILSAWTGIRPLVRDVSKKNSESLVRSYKIIDSGNKFIIATGGKWTTYRRMSEKCIDTAIKSFGLKPKKVCLTKYIQVLGSDGYAKDLYYRIKEFLNVDITYAEHLMRHYGTKAFLLKKYLEKFPEKLSEKYEFRAAEVIYCVDYEYAMTVADVLNNRFRLGFIDVREAADVAIKIEKLMAKYLGWSTEYRKNQSKETVKALHSFGYDIIQDYSVQ